MTATRRRALALLIGLAFAAAWALVAALSAGGERGGFTPVDYAPSGD